jgi:hypothetical protein
MIYREPHEPRQSFRGICIMPQWHVSESKDPRPWPAVTWGTAFLMAYMVAHAIPVAFRVFHIVAR